jgi:hypothetical protein
VLPNELWVEVLILLRRDELASAEFMMEADVRYDDASES